MWDRRIGHKRHYGAERLRRLFARHGFALVDTEYTGHPVKIAQLAVSVLAKRTGLDASRLWWALERVDLRASRRALWALQVSAVFERQAPGETV